LAGSGSYQIFTSPVCLAIAFYFAEKKFRAVKAKEKIALLCNYIKIADATAACVQKTTLNKAVLDFEDGIEYYSAEESNCNCIVTEDVEDFHFAEMEVLTSETFFEKYLMRK
jgi:predicted nucleic acid-binding protein